VHRYLLLFNTVGVSSAAENIIRGGGMCIGLGNKISDGRATVHEGWLWLEKYCC